MKTLPTIDETDLPGTTAEDIIKFIGNKAASGVISWVATTAFKKLIGSTTLSDISRELEQVLANQQVIMEQIQQVLERIKWQTRIINSFKAQENIRIYFQKTQLIAQEKTKSTRIADAKQLRETILSDGSDGLWQSLEIIHDVLISASSLSDEKSGLLQLFEMELNSLMYPSKGLLPWEHYYAKVNGYLALVFYIQFVGLTLYVSAYHSKHGRHQGDLAEELVKKTFARLDEQKKLLYSLIPSAAHHMKQHPGSAYILTFLGRNKFNTITGLKNDEFPVMLKNRSSHLNQVWQFVPSPEHKAKGSYLIGLKNRNKKHGWPGGFMGHPKLYYNIACNFSIGRTAMRAFIIPMRDAKHPERLQVRIYCPSKVQPKYYQGYLGHLGLRKVYQGMYYLMPKPRPFVIGLTPVEQ